MRILGILVGACSLTLLVACGGGSASPMPTITQVVVSCSPISIASQQTSQCAASVLGTGNFSSAVTSGGSLLL
jgi:hypothetical protein